MILWVELVNADKHPVDRHLVLGRSTAVGAFSVQLATYYSMSVDILTSATLAVVQCMSHWRILEITGNY